jgi:hypothetical protein
MSNAKAKHWSRHHKHTKTLTERIERRAARVKIVKEAERARGWSSKPYSMRRLNQAVCVARRRGLVSDAVLFTAGFNPRKPPKNAVVPVGPDAPPRGRRATRARKAAA